jgi:hypothetical protein
MYFAGSYLDKTVGGRRCAFDSSAITSDPDLYKLSCEILLVAKNENGRTIAICVYEGFVSFGLTLLPIITFPRQPVQE